jgi:hypothetical protein
MLLIRTDRQEISSVLQNASEFTVCFVKRGDGQERVMHCLRGQAFDKYVKGGTLRYSAVEKDLLAVVDKEKVASGENPIRMVSLSSIKWATVGQATFVVA